ncbi:MAG: hypothetical protein ACYC5O_21610 [Anaerolineae bacterium]
MARRNCLVPKSGRPPDGSVAASSLGYIVVDCILDGVRPTPDIADGLACLRVLLAVEEAARADRAA